MPLVRPFATADGTITTRDILLVRVLAGGAEGWGECGAATSPGYWHETLDTARASLPAIIRGAVIADEPMAHAAFEMAMLDLTLRERGVSLADHLGATRASVVATATAGFDDDVTAFVDAGYRSVKVKIDPEHMLRERPRAPIVQVDANQSFTGRGDAFDVLATLDELDVLAVEQPLARDDIDGHVALAARVAATVLLDESITSITAIDDVLRRGTQVGIVVKPARLGGVAAAQHAHDVCAAAGVPAKVGGLLETGIGRAASLAVAALPGFTLPADLSESDRYWDEDLTAPFVLDGDGCLAVPRGAGLGVDVRMDVVERATVWRDLISVRT